MSTIPSDDYDFGFTFADEEATTTQVVTESNNEEISELKEKLDALLSAQEQTLNSAMVTAIEEKYKAKLKEVEGLILPLLLNLKKNPEKAYINWPNRATVIDKQIEKITKVTRG
jgi:microcystin degradation protein MlrC